MSIRRRDLAKRKAAPMPSIRSAPSARPMIDSTKQCSHPAPGGERRQDARGEFAMLRRCRGIAGVPAALELIEDARPRDPGCATSTGTTAQQSGGRLVAICAGHVAADRLVWALARRGVRHNDLRPENVIIAPDGRVHLVDFDQASTGSLAECLLAGLGLPVGGAPVCNGLFAPLRERIQARLSPRLVRALRGRRLRPARTCPLPPLPAGASASLQAAARGLAHRRGCERLAPRDGRSPTTSWNSMACACRASARGRRAGAVCATRPRTRTAACSSSAAIWPWCPPSC